MASLHNGTSSGQQGSESRPLSFRSLLPWHLLILLAVTFQYVLAWLWTPDGANFTGALLNPDDIGVYVSAMRQGATGEWLYHFVYSPEPWQPRLMLMLYLVMGKITAIFASPNVVWLHAWRVLLTCVTLASMVLWVKTVLPSAVRWQWTAWFLIWFGGGLGWLFVIFWPSFAGWTLNTGIAEWTPIISLFNTPHFALGLGLEVATFAFLVRAERAIDRNRWLWAAASSIAALLATLVYVYHLATILLVIGFYMLALALRERKIPWRKWLVGAIVVIPLLPLLGYYTLWTNGDPYWIHYTTVDHVIPPPPPISLLIGLGFLGFLALPGGRIWLKSGRTILVPIWAVVNIFLLYVPSVSFSGRFALGLLIPIATLAAVGIEGVLLPALFRSSLSVRLSRLSSSPCDTMRRIFLIILMPSVLLLVLLMAEGPMRNSAFPYYLPSEDVAAAKWLGEHSNKSSITLAYYPIGNYLPSVYAGKVYVGQLDFTTDLDGKLEQFEQFWDGTMMEREREMFLEKWGITHVFVGSYERDFNSADVTPPGRLVYESDGAEIYEVIPD